MLDFAINCEVNESTVVTQTLIKKNDKDNGAYTNNKHNYKNLLL